MRVLLTHRPGGAYGYITESWKNTFNAAGIVVDRWDGNQESWDAFQPDLYIGCSGHKQNIPKNRSSTRIAIHVNPFGPVDMGPINETEDNKRWVKLQNPDVVFYYGFSSQSEYWSYWWSKYGIRPVPMANALDHTLFNRTYDQNDKKYDLVYVGGKWAYKSKSIDKYLIPVLNNNYNFKLHGWGDWDKSHNSGDIKDHDVPTFLASGLIGPCISEPHTHEFGIDIPERVFKVIGSGTVAIHDNVSILKELIPSLQVADTPDIFRDMCDHWIKQDHAERELLAKRQYNHVIKNHTYAHRLSDLVKQLGFDKESKLLLESINDKLGW